MIPHGGHNSQRYPIHIFRNNQFPEKLNANKSLAIAFQVIIILQRAQ
jgi:hypothetical protein